MNLIQLFQFAYFIIFLLICKKSCRNGILFFWGSLFIIPSIILNIHIVSFINVYVLQIIIASFFFLFNANYKQSFLAFCKNSKSAILIIFIMYALTIIFSDEVPFKIQCYYFFKELFQFLIIIETFIIAKNDSSFILRLYKILLILLLCNIAYSFIFEICFRTNPAGLPLYLLIGQDNNEYLVDAIDSQRGTMGFRLQSIFGHPLSLGQYYLLMIPLFLSNMQYSKKYEWIIAILLSVNIFLSGTRGAIFPMLLILGLYMIKSNIRFYKLILILPLFVIAYLFLPLQKQQIIDNYYDSLTTYIQFWDDKKQAKYNVEGSSINMRIEQFKAAKAEIKHNILFGKGIGYREYYQEQHNQLHPQLLGYESFVLLKLVEQGWIGIFIFLLIISYLYYILSKECPNTLILQLIFIAFLFSTFMTGIRPFSFLLLGLSGIIATKNNNQKT